MEQEIWKPVVGFEGYYEISSIGRLKSVKRSYEVNGRWNKTHIRHMEEKLYKPYMAKTGYWDVFIHLHGRHRQSIHRMVAKAFIPNPGNKGYVNHINSIRTDNRVGNLEWVTHQENMMHGYLHGSLRIPASVGQDNGRAVLTNEQVLEIRKLYKEGMRPKQLIEKYQLKKATLEGVIYNTKWKHLL